MSFVKCECLFYKTYYLTYASTDKSKYKATPSLSKEYFLMRVYIRFNVLTLKDMSNTAYNVCVISTIYLF